MTNTLVFTIINAALGIGLVGLLAIVMTNMARVGSTPERKIVHGTGAASASDRLRDRNGAHRGEASRAEGRVTQGAGRLALPGARQAV